MSDSDDLNYNPSHGAQSDNKESIQESLMANDLQKRRHKKSDPSTWKKNVVKRKRLSGESYVNRGGKVVDEKSPKPCDCNACRYHCNLGVNEDIRKAICAEYYGMADYVKQKMFLSSLIRSDPTVRKKTGTEKNRSMSRSYFLPTGNGEIQRVCQKFFLSTFNISHRIIETCMKQVGDSGIFMGDDGRKSGVPSNKTSQLDISFVKKHIDSFPRVESHYCRGESTEEYLDSDLNIATMYRLYTESCKSENIKHVSLKVYRKIFNSYIPSLSFFIEKKDQCQLCNRYTSGDEAIDWIDHRRRADEAMQMKEMDKMYSIQVHGETFRTITFDFQAILSVPHAGDNQIYYKRKLNLYNFTVYEVHNQNGLCYLWDETNGSKDSCEIGTCLLKYFSSLPESVKHVSTFSDTCGGQNCNKYIAAAMLYAVNNFAIETIDMKFMESGHSYLETDSMHSVIERARKHKKLYTTREWAILIRMARKKPWPYNVDILLFNDIFDLKDLSSNVLKNTSKNTDGEQVNWLLIKWLRFKKENPKIIQYKHNLSDEAFLEIDVDGKKQGRKADLVGKELITRYQNKIEISLEKKKDLCSLLQNGLIPKDYSYFYENLI